ncbi:MAG: ABC transporter substrate-binding protein [Kouleothrix sp.]|nr:ABC transporter substrate-binding protein [Kouleothrix sp.]
MHAPKPSTHHAWHYRMLLVGIAVITLILAACGTPPPPKVYRVGVLSGLEYAAGVTDGFKAGLSELGYREGENISYDIQATNIDPVAYQRILQGFVANKVDLILAFPTEAALDAKAIAATNDIPVVFGFAQIEGVNLVKSVREPGKNLTGVRLPGPELAIKRFEVMHTIVPQAKRILVPYLRDYPIVPPQLEALRPVAAAAGVTLVELPVASPDELEAALKLQGSGDTVNVDAILQLVEPVAVTPAFFVVLGRFAAEHRLPLGGAYLSVDGYESLFGIHVDSKDIGHDAASLADKVLKGAPAGSIPVISGDSIFQINYREAQRLGLSIPAGIISEADQVLK